MDIAIVTRRASLAMAIGCLAVGLLTPILATEDPGVRLDVQGDRIVVTEVNAYSNAGMGGMAAGDVALELNGRTLVRIPQYVYGPGAHARPDHGRGR